MMKYVKKLSNRSKEKNFILDMLNRYPKRKSMRGISIRKKILWVILLFIKWGPSTIISVNTANTNAKLILLFIWGKMRSVANHARSI